MSSSMCGSTHMDCCVGRGRVPTVAQRPAASLRPAFRLHRVAPHTPLRAAPNRERAAAAARRGRSRACTPVAALPPIDLRAATLLAPTPGLAAGLFVNTSVYILGLKVLLGGLTPAGIVHSWFLGSAVYAAFGLSGYVLVCVYFVLGSAVTKLKLKQKQAEGIAEARGGLRGPPSVWGSGVAALACAVGALCTDCTMSALWRIGFVASLASKLNDTTASEVGKAYGRTTYLSTTFQRVPRGTEGAVSVEGTLAGAAASALMAALALLGGQVTVVGCGIVVVAACVANTFESMLGATLQGNVGWLTNDVVNMLQITVAAAVAMGLLLLV